MLSITYNLKNIFFALIGLFFLLLVGKIIYDKLKPTNVMELTPVIKTGLVSETKPAKPSSLLEVSTSTNQIVSPQNTKIEKATSSKINSISTTTNVTILPVVEDPIKVIKPASNVLVKSEIMAWIYPGGTSCLANTEYSDGRKIDVLKPEYFSVNESGDLILLTTKNSGCNAYSSSNVADLKKYSKEQYVTVSSSYAGSMDMFLTNSLNESTNINTLVTFIVSNNLTGIEIDFEDFGGWSDSSYLDYKKFITKLGESLHAKNKKLMIDGPATSNTVEEAWYVWRYADFNNLPIDRVVVMTYDYQYDQGAGQPVAPISWIQNTIKFTLSRFSNKAKLSIGIPSYGYKGVINTQKFSLLTYNQIKKEPGFSTSARDPDSAEMTWQNGNNVYFYQDSESILKKIQTVQSSGINSVSIWHLGGNEWFVTK